MLGVRTGSAVERAAITKTAKVTTMAATKADERDIVYVPPVSKIRRRSVKPSGQPELLEHALARAEQRLQETRGRLDTARRKFFEAKSIVSQLRRQIMPPVEAAIADIGRQRHRQFARHLVRLMQDGTSVGDALHQAAEAIYPSRKSPEAIARKAREMAGRPEISAVICVVMDQGGMDMGEVARKHIELIRSNDPKVSLKAIKLYWQLTLPKPVLEASVPPSPALNRQLTP